MVDVALVQTYYLLHVQGREHVHAQDQGSKSWGILLDDADDAVRKAVLEVRIRPRADFGIDVIGGVLHEDLAHVFAWWCDGIVEGARDRHLYHRARGRHSPTGLSVRLVDLPHVALEVHRASMLRSRRAIRRRRRVREVRQTGESQVKLEAAARVVRVLDVPLKIGWQGHLLRIQQLEEGVVRVCPGENSLASAQPPAIPQQHRRGATGVVALDLGHSGAHHELRPGLLCRRGDRHGHRAHAAFAVGPHAFAPGGLAHHVM
mmetsp:Transcript_30576/g.101714  ORF Transcript_30576/g.101714 Transcript_30576/m.101714 type:complete len:261 (-) Transcript_30576:862-1644(-)